MSLFNEIASSLAGKGGLTGTINKTVGGAIQGASTSLFGSGPVGRAVASVATGQATGALNRVTNGYTRQINGVAGAIGEAVNGNYETAAMRLLDSNVIPGLTGIGGQALFWNIPNPLFGGVTPARAMAIHQEIVATRYSKRNLFLLEVQSDLGGSFTALNFFATGVDYAPYTISGEKYRIGAASVDSVQSSDPVELRITTLDDSAGNIKTWFATHAQAAANADGTVGLPNDYKIRIRIVHSSVESFGGHAEVGFYRAANMEHSLSRREDDLEEINLTFVQLDTFMYPHNL